ncbi:hypothetical protein JOY44_28335 (plasmid) [Phormidium sp. CLA17]|uniref:hypothetical protein n=1 Tax=Leptolyngbya sp. Cla-17 TaxID=2803751 RepID=UPI00149236CB|nr:hypothetical protein [Leptolyngbya sp. Cla-17]MBM0745337.1 hypothetical protein [Leptolyngbya sp. Cla-17]
MSQYYRQVRQDERPIRYFAQDESRFGLHTLIGRLITAVGVKPIGAWQWIFKAFWLYGAVEPTTGESFFLQFSHVDTACYQWFLDEFSKAYPDSLNILQVDNGRFHKGKDLIVPENIIAVFCRMRYGQNNREQGFEPLVCTSQEPETLYLGVSTALLPRVKSYRAFMGTSQGGSQVGCVQNA